MRVSGNLIWDVALCGLEQELRRHQRTACRQRQGAGGNFRRRRRSARVSSPPTTRYDGQARLAILDHTRPGRSRFRKAGPANCILHGGGTTWMPGTYDPQLNTIYWGTSNPAPDFEGSVRPGDDLYTDCVLALEPDTGKLKWYFQFTPHDLFDYDGCRDSDSGRCGLSAAPRRKLARAGEPERIHVYVLDRTSGKFLSASPRSWKN
jgi:glucose dehydrogenase